MQNRINLVDRKSETAQWKAPKHFPTRSDYTIRCSHDRGLRGSMQRGNNRGILAAGGTEPPHKHPGIKSSKLSNTDFHQAEESPFDTYTNIQHNSTVLPNQDGWNEKQNVDRHCQRADWESRNVQDSSEWKHHFDVSQKICKIYGMHLESPTNYHAT